MLHSKEMEHRIVKLGKYWKIEKIFAVAMHPKFMVLCSQKTYIDLNLCNVKALKDEDMVEMYISSIKSSIHCFGGNLCRL